VPDSTFSLPYTHGIESAIASRETVGAFRLLESFGRYAPDTRYLAQLRLLADFTVGDPAARATSEAALDTLEIQRLFWLGVMLGMTNYWDRAEHVFGRVHERGDLGWQALPPLFFASLAQARVSDAHRLLEDPFTPRFRKAAMLQVLVEIGGSATGDA